MSFLYACAGLGIIVIVAILLILLVEGVHKINMCCLACQNIGRKIKRSWCCEKRKRLNTAQVQVIYELTKGHCYYCKKHLGNVEKRRGRWEIDHVTSWIQGGANDDLVAACFSCNQKKKAKSLSMFCEKHNYQPQCRYVDPNVKHFTCQNTVADYDYRRCLMHNCLTFFVS